MNQSPDLQLVRQQCQEFPGQFQTLQLATCNENGMPEASYAAYVAHEGGVSFAESTQALMKIGGERLLAKHPTYDAQVAEWIARDPAKTRRDEISAALAL